MSDLKNEIQAVNATVKADWTDEHALEVERKFVRHYRRRKTVRRIGKSIAALACLLGGGLTLVHFYAGRTPSPAAIAKVDRVIRFADGSTATPTSTDSDMQATSSVPNRTVVEVKRGGARFAVTKNPARVFRVEAGRVAVEVLGTQFSVERTDARVRVAVDEGRVRVLWEGGQTVLSLGQSGLFPPESATSPSEPAISPPFNEEPSPAPHKPAVLPHASKSPSWKDLARDGEYERAYEILATDAPSSLHDEPAELLLAADVKRLSHHPSEALDPLRKIIVAHSADPRAPLAAFTLGRVLLEELGQPNEAAEAFSRAEALAPNGALAQDALAREVEAWSRAGNSAHARTRAEEYVRRYPDGRKLLSVRRFGGIE